ncbi:uncharacterized protein LOC105436764 [Strongylocentrotus purpuratus]|uniref:Uncharacterized protein n=1 Tax=Strongylocentrotus purpuratus TaxID=7668 RepID=A0A7M7PA74_STRPU|nr:uncharacterized protein LOC105436764 [Strongylocentrotus purpuratus]
MESCCGKFVFVAWVAAALMLPVVFCQTDAPTVAQSISPRTQTPSQSNTEIYQWVVGIVSVLIAFTLITIIGLLFRLFFHYVQERRLKRFGYLRSKVRRGRRRDRSQRAYVIATKRPPPVPTLSQRVHVDEYGHPVVDDYGYIPPPPPHSPPAPPINYQSGVVHNSSRSFVPIVDSYPEPLSDGLLMAFPQPYQEQQIPSQLTNQGQDTHVTRPSRLQHGPSHPPTIPEEDPIPNLTNQDALPQQQGKEHRSSTSKQEEDLPRDHDHRRSISAASVEDYGGWRRSAHDDEFIFGRRDSSRRSGSRSHRHHSGNRRDRNDRDPIYQSLSPSVVEQAVVRNPMHTHNRRF